MLYKEALKLTKYFKPDLLAAIKNVRRSADSVDTFAKLPPNAHTGSILKVPVMRYGKYDAAYGPLLERLLKRMGLDPAQYSVRGIVSGNSHTIPRDGTYLRRTFVGEPVRTPDIWKGVPYEGNKLTARNKLYASTADGTMTSYSMYPTGSASPYFGNVATDPTADVIFNDKYIDKQLDGKVLQGVALDMSDNMRAKQKHVTSSDRHLVPHKTFRQWFMQSPTAVAPDVLHDMQASGQTRVADMPSRELDEVVRSGIGKADDVVAAVIRPHNTTGVLVTRNGITHKTQMPSSNPVLSSLPFTQAVRGDFRHEANRAEQLVRYMLQRVRANTRMSFGDKIMKAQDILETNDFHNVPSKLVQYLLTNRS